jgi:HAD superfamily hydrolase (TIGR01509 family)
VISAVVFDMDGVVSDTERLHQEVERLILAPYGIAPTSNQTPGRFAGMSDREFFPAVFAAHAVMGDVEAAIAEKWRRMAELAPGAIAAVPGALELIAELRAGGFRLALASASPRAFIDQVLDALAIRDRFDAVVSADEAARGKPEPDVFLLAARRLGVAPGECVVIEDAENGMTAARRAGMRCVGLVHAGDLSRCPADLCVSDLRTLTPEALARL